MRLIIIKRRVLKMNDEVLNMFMKFMDKDLGLIDIFMKRRKGLEIL